MNKMYSEMPRERHYALGHEVFRQFAESNPHQFFEIMASEKRTEFLSMVIERVYEACPSDNTELAVEDIEVTTSRLENYPLVIIKMPEVKAYVEAIYVAVLGLFDVQNLAESEAPEIGYFTLEIGEGETGAQNYFCQWQGDTHYNLAELDDNLSIETFTYLIEQRLASNAPVS